MSHRGHRGHRGGYRGRGRGRGHFHKKDDKDEVISSPWHQKVKDNWESNLDLDFADYEGEKKHDLPEDFLAILNNEKTKVFFSAKRDILVGFLVISRNFKTVTLKNVIKKSLI